MKAALPLILCLGSTLSGCIDECVGFDEVEIDGGTADERATVTEALRDFAGWMTRDAVCAERISIQDRIEVEGLDGVALGRYDAGDQEIAVVGKQRFLYDTTVHELCHAVDFQDAVSVAFPELFELAPFYQVAGPREPESLQREALALDCEVGAPAVALGRQASLRCDAPATHERMNVLMALVYDAVDPFVPTVPVQVVERGSIELPDGFLPIGTQPVGTTSEDQLLVIGEVDGVATALALDPITGQLEPPRGAFLFGEQTVGTPGRIHALGAVDLGIGTFTAIHWPLASGDVLRFLALRSAAGWALPADPCLDGPAWVVEAEDLPWLVELEGRTLRWSLVDPP